MWQRVYRILLALLLPLTVWAEAPSIPPVVVTGSYLDSAVGLTVISRADIEATGATGLGEILRRQTGMSFIQGGVRGSTNSLFIRGGDPNFAVIMIDGVKVNDPTDSRGGSFDFSSIDLNSVERIEILKGARSAIYGSDALSGVVNIITRLPITKLESEVSIFGGSDDTGGTGARVGARGEKWGLGLSGAASHIGEIEEDGGNYNNGSVSLRSEFAPFAEFSGDLVARYAKSRTDVFPDDSGGGEFAVIRELEDRDQEQFTVGFNLRGEVLSDIESTLRFQYFRQDRDTLSPGVAPGLRNPFGIPPQDFMDSFERITIGGEDRFLLGDGLSIVFGSEIQIEDGESGGFLTFGPVEVPTDFSLNRTTWSGYVESEFEIADGWQLRGGARLDDTDGVATEVSPQVGLNYVASSGEREVYLQYSEGFKAPSFYALGNPIVGNSDLKSETSRGVEFGVDQVLIPEELTAEFVLFSTEYKDTVDFDPGPPPQLVNRSKIRAKGGELTVMWKPVKMVELQGSASYTDSTISELSRTPLNRPKWRGGVGVGVVASERLRLNLYSNYTGTIFDSSIPTGDVELSPFWRTDASVQYKATEQLSTFIAIDNLLDKHYEEIVGFGHPGVRVRIGANWKL